MSLTIAGAGLGLRAKHFDTILTEQPPVPWFEVVADQFLHSNGIIIDKLEQISSHYPLVLHCLGQRPLLLGLHSGTVFIRLNATATNPSCCYPRCCSCAHDSRPPGAPPCLGKRLCLPGLS